MNGKQSIPEIIPLVLEWYAKPENASGGIFHCILEDGNHEQRWADMALEDAVVSGDKLAVKLAMALAAMSSTQRRKLSAMTLNDV